MTKGKKKVLSDVKVATGFAILLVVIGHLASRGESGIDQYVNLKTVIYKFHMPLFLFLSGYISGYNYEKIEGLRDYQDFIKKKFLRIMPAYFLLSIIFLTGKYFVGQQKEFSEGIYSILIYPAKGNSGFLWYIYVLFLYYLILPIIMAAVQNKFYLFFLISLIVSFLPLPEIMSLNLFFWYLPFFSLGCFLSNNIPLYNYYLKIFGKYILIVFSGFLILDYFIVLKIPKFVMSYIAIFGIHHIGLNIFKENKHLRRLGDNSFSIYLFNSIFIGGFTFFLKKIMGEEDYIEYFYTLCPFLLCSGLYLPIFLYKVLEKRAPWIAKYIH